MQAPGLRQGRCVPARPVAAQPTLPATRKPAFPGSGRRFPDIRLAAGASASSSSQDDVSSSSSSNTAAAADSLPAGAHGPGVCYCCGPRPDGPVVKVLTYVQGTVVEVEDEDGNIIEIEGADGGADADDDEGVAELEAWRATQQARLSGPVVVVEPVAIRPGGEPGS